MRVGIVINPISGRSGGRSGEAERRFAFATARAEAMGADAVVRLTEGPGHAREIAQTFVDQRRDTVIAMGGDGTANEVAQALVGTSTALGILPCGSGDGLARGLGLPVDRDLAMTTALTSDAIRMDVGYAGDRMFLNIAGIGFDGAIARQFGRGTTRGLTGYLRAGLPLLLSYDSRAYDVHWHSGAEEHVRRGRRFLVGFANASTYGNGAVLAPDADVQDGLLDVVIVAAGRPMSQLWRARRLFMQHRRPAAGLERSRAVSAVVEGQKMLCHVDGEPFEASGTLAVRLRSGALLVRAPGRRQAP